MAYVLRYHTEDNQWKEGSLRIASLGEGITAVFADTEAGANLDMECGAIIDLDDSDWESFMADERYSEFWCRPAFGERGSQLPSQTQYLLIKLRSGRYRVILPVVSEDYKCILYGNTEGAHAMLFSWCSGIRQCKGLAFITAEGEDPFLLTETAVKEALKILNHGCRHRHDRHYPSVLEYLGWCSWDAFPADQVSEAGILRKCEEFRAKQIPVRWAILDDMWAQIRDFDTCTYSTRQEMFDVMHASYMSDYEASYKRFPQGLAHCLQQMWEQYQMISAIWHPTTGYWMGLERGSPAEKKLSAYTMTAIDGRVLGDWHEEKSFGYFGTMHRFFRECGAAFVKVDNQSMYRRFYKGMDTVGKICREYHRGLEASVGVYFDGAMINCMGMASEDMWNRPSSAISRCSGDFQPEDRPWFIKHILQCTYNSLIQGQFYWSDYDMWWTDDSQGPKNALLRAVSGGPIYVSDTLDRSRKEILEPLCFGDGRILRCDRPGMPTADCLTVDPEQSGAPLKIQNQCGCAGVIAAFNIHRENCLVRGTVSADDIPGLEAGTYTVYEHFTGETVILAPGEKLEISLEDQDTFRLYVFVPYENGFAPIGLVDKFISPLSITNRVGENVTLYEKGRYGYVRDGKLIIENR